MAVQSWRISQSPVSYLLSVDCHSWYLHAVTEQWHLGSAAPHESQPVNELVKSEPYRYSLPALKSAMVVLMSLQAVLNLAWSSTQLAAAERNLTV